MWFLHCLLELVSARVVLPSYIWFVHRLFQLCLHTGGLSLTSGFCILVSAWVIGPCMSGFQGCISATFSDTQCSGWSVQGLQLGGCSVKTGFHMLSSTEIPLPLPSKYYSALTDLTQPAFPVGLQQLLSLDQKVGGAPRNYRQINRKVGVVNLSCMRIYS